MNVSDIPGATVDSYLKLIRLPLDAAIQRLPGNGTGAAPTARWFVDRADASLRALLANLFGDSLLREDAEQRQAAADERKRALRLRGAAERKREEADSRLDQREAQASRQREQANRRASTRREQAAKVREQKTRRAVQAEDKRLDASRKAEVRGDQAIDERAPKARLDTLDAKADALRKKEQAITAADEARRLREAAGRTKAERKNDR